MEKRLTIAIPTYNRKGKLYAQLELIRAQNCEFLHEVLIIDNASDESYADLAEDWCRGDLRKKIRIIKNYSNIGMSVNLLMPFLNVNSGWLWLLSDDDRVLGDCLAQIERDINTYAGAGMIKYSLTRRAENVEITGVKEFISYCNNAQGPTPGELVFYSNCVYNVSCLQGRLEVAFENANTYIGFLYPMFDMLKKSDVSIVYSGSPIVNHIPPEKSGYSYLKVAKALARIRDFEIASDSKMKKNFSMLFQSITARKLLIYIVREDVNINFGDFIFLFCYVFRYQRFDFFALISLLLNRSKILRLSLKRIIYAKNIS